MSTFNPAYPVHRERAVQTAPPAKLWNSSLPADEQLNQITHGVGFLLALVGAVVLLASAPFVDGTRAFGAIVYAMALTGLYLSSTLSHSFLDRERRTFWRVADQVAILGMTVGSFVPFALVHAPNMFGWTLLSVTSIAAAILSVIRIIRWEKGVPILAMVVVGLLPALASYQMVLVGGVAGTILIACGAASYCGGLWFLVNDHRRVYYHAIWHIATIVGSTFHFVFVYLWCIVDVI